MQPVKPLILQHQLQKLVTIINAPTRSLVSRRSKSSSNLCSRNNPCRRSFNPVRVNSDALSLLITAPCLPKYIPRLANAMIPAMPGAISLNTRIEELHKFRIARLGDQLSHKLALALASQVYPTAR